MKWFNRAYQPVENLDNFQVPTSDGMVLTADCLSKNGYYGACFVSRYEGRFFISAGSNDTGKDWKSPGNSFATVKEAVEKCEELWRPA